MSAIQINTGVSRLAVKHDNWDVIDLNDENEESHSYVGFYALTALQNTEDNSFILIGEKVENETDEPKIHLEYNDGDGTVLTEQSFNQDQYGAIVASVDMVIKLTNSEHFTLT